MNIAAIQRPTGVYGLKNYGKIKSQTQSHSKKMKSKRRESVNSLSLLNVLNLPGKKKLCTELTKSASKIFGKCNTCRIIFESKEDKVFC